MGVVMDGVIQCDSWISHNSIQIPYNIKHIKVLFNVIPGLVITAFRYR